MKRYKSTKTYCHSTGLSACFRQWRADSHCKHVHGYALEVGIIFSAEDLDYRNWVVDFGSLKDIKQWLVDTFDHKTLVAEDDPMLEYFKEGHKKGLLDLVVVPAVGCERFAELIYDKVNEWLEMGQYKGRVKLSSVEVKEHGSNSAIVETV